VMADCSWENAGEPIPRQIQTKIAFFMAFTGYAVVDNL
jgi:hypothetical protein